MTRRAAKSAFTCGAASTPPSQTSSKWRSSMARSSSRLEQVEVERVLEVGRLVGGEHEHRRRRPATTRASSATWGSGSVKCSMRCDEQAPSKLAGSEPEAQGVHLRHPEALGAVAGGGRGDGLGGVVDPDHLAAGAEEAGRLEALATAHVEDAAPADPLEDGPVARLVQGQQRVGGHPLLRPLARQPALRAGHHGRSPFV